MDYTLGKTTVGRCSITTPKKGGVQRAAGGVGVQELSYCQVSEEVRASLVAQMVKNLPAMQETRSRWPSGSLKASRMAMAGKRQ